MNPFVIFLIQSAEPASVLVCATTSLVSSPPFNVQSSLSSLSHSPENHRNRHCAVSEFFLPYPRQGSSFLAILNRALNLQYPIFHHEERFAISVSDSSEILSLATINRLRRKNVTKGYSDAQVKVRKATSNDAWGPEGADMAEIAQMTFDRYLVSLFE